jgi:Holliday junction resolvase
MGPEAKLYQKIKKASPNILWNRIENLSIPGMPDALGYNKRNVFFTVEFKIAKGNKIKFSPHQIAWHKTHPKNSRGPWSKVLENFFTIPVPWFKDHGA